MICGCSKKKKMQTVIPQEEILDIKPAHKWYYFSSNGFTQIDKPQNAPAQGLLPYTEALRISAANNANDDDSGNKAFAVVNRLGMLCFEGQNISLAKDVSVFTDRTAENLVFVNNTPVFSVYKSSFFNNSISLPEYKQDSSQHFFLVQFDDEAKITYPLINCNNLIKEGISEVVDYVWDGEKWLCCVKSASEISGKTDFSYIKFTPAVPLLSLSPVVADENLVVSEISVSEYRRVLEVNKYEKAPERIRKMLAGFSSTIPFEIEVKSAGGSSPRIYENTIADSKEQVLKAKAIISQSWSCALFEDGTLFLEGALPGKHILRGGKPIAIRLPKLEPGFVYSDFVISGTTLYAAWEETDFYKTNRSGFISVDLDSTLYSKIR